MWPCGHIELRVLTDYFDLRHALSFSFSWWLFLVWCGDDEKHSNLGSISSIFFYWEMPTIMSSVVNDLLCTLAHMRTGFHDGTNYSGKFAELIYSQVSFNCWEHLSQYLFLWCIFFLNMQVSITSNSIGTTCQVHPLTIWTWLAFSLSGPCVSPSPPICSG